MTAPNDGKIFGNRATPRALGVIAPLKEDQSAVATTALTPTAPPAAAGKGRAAAPAVMLTANAATKPARAGKRHPSPVRIVEPINRITKAHPSKLE
ncbi:MAG: hypothetical protein HKL96_05210, partial [Phycisphaerales bacterium]|nr:hypothetical protein [Phycisphaerales bacterium]